VTVSASTLYDFGIIRMQTVTYTNNTGSRVTFMQASMSSARYGQTNTCGDVAAGASCSATITYYPTNSGSDTATFTVTSSAPNSPHVVNLTTAAAPAASQPVSGGVKLSATALTFNSGSNSTRTVTYTNNTSSTVTFLQASIDSGKFGQKNTCGDLAPGASCTATVTFYKANSGSTSATFRMTSTAPNSPHLVTLSAN
jgi:hypothetical protein